MINKLLVVEGGTLRSYLGNYSDYLRKRQESEAIEEAPVTKSPEARAEWEDMKHKRRERQKHERRLRDLETEIERIEGRLQEIDDLLADEVVQVDWQRLAELGNEKTLLEGKLEELFPELEKVSAKIDKEDS
jgi:ATP-binding cassette subfamily F protein 3